MFDYATTFTKALAQRDEALKLIKRIQDALGTAEEGEGLIEVARNAHRAELEMANQVIFDGP